MLQPWKLEEQDRECFERELDDFVPPKVFDAHAHLWCKSHFTPCTPEFVQAGPDEIALETYREYMSWILPGREVHGLHFAFPATFPNDTTAPNAWVSQEIKKDPLARGQFYVRPTDDPEWVRQEMKRLSLRGFKPFNCFADRPDKENAEIPEHLPEWIPRLAHEEGWSITLHMNRARSLADASNRHWIATYCEKFPEMTLILDHCARGFNPYHVIEGLDKLPPLHNLYVDTSVCCSPLAIWACIHYLGIDHVLYASDFYCSHIRGTNLPIGGSFLWLTESAQDAWDSILYGQAPILIGLENLRAVKAVFRMLNLEDNAVESYFWKNAERLFMR